MINDTGLKSQIENEIQSYLTSDVNISDNYSFSQYKLVKRISLFESRTFPNGKTDSQGNYKFYYDIIGPRVDNEVKNIDFDTKDINIYSPRKNDGLACIISNLKLREFLRTHGQAEEINSALEEGSGWGNVVWKKVKNSYERADLRNFYVINQTASCLKESPVIERHQFSQSDLRANDSVWKNVKEIINDCKSETYQSTVDNVGNDSTVPYYTMYERNGEVSLKDLNDYNGIESKPGDEDIYVFAKVIAAGSKGSAGGVEIKYIAFAEEMPNKDNSDIYKEFHRGSYKGRWFREGIYELLFDCQVRANQIGNQIAAGLEYAAKIFFTTPDKLIVQNVLTDLKNGDIIKSTGLNHVSVRMDGFDQLVADWNRTIALANSIANSQEIAQGMALPSGTPLGLGQMLNINANKLYEFIREKLAIPLSGIFEEWIVPSLVKELRTDDIIRLTGDSDMMDRLYDVIAIDWYINNLVEIGPHDAKMRDELIADKIAELKSRPEIRMQGVKILFEGFTPSVDVDITGESLNIDVELKTLQTFVALEADPVRRTAMIELMMKMKGIDVGGLPKTPPAQMVGPVGAKSPLEAMPVK